EDRETRGFISMTMMRPSRGLTANWMLHPPVSTPTPRLIALPRSRSLWYSRSVRVSAGATVIESPVCTPMGSRFSIEQTTTTLSTWSRMTSSSYSFHPAIDSSRSTSVVGESCRPEPAMRRRSASSWAKPEPDHAQQVSSARGEPRAQTAHGEGRANDHWVAELRCGGKTFVHGVRDTAARRLATTTLDDALEQLTVLAKLDGLDAGTDQRAAVLLQNAPLVQGDGRVERRLAAEGRKNRVGAFLGDDRLHRLGS